MAPEPSAQAPEVPSRNVPRKKREKKCMQTHEYAEILQLWIYKIEQKS